MNLEQNYNRDDFLSFLKSFIPKFSKDIRRVATDGLQVTKEASYLGESPEFNLSVFEITHSSSADARVALAMDGFRVMKNSATYRALVIYRAEKGEDWRLSLMTATPDVNKKGKIGQVFSNPRRFSFFLGPNAKVNTPYQFLIKQGTVKDFAELQKRFSIEVVSKEFYQEIAELFTKLVGGIRGIGSKEKKYKGIIELPFVDSESQISHEFGVRLIGRIIFCWFLREKKSDSGLPLVPKKLLSLDSAQKTKDFYHTRLEPLFFEVLNKPIGSRNKQYSKDFYAQIPYLNGGLFLPQEHDFYSFDEGSQAINHNIVKIPDEWLVELSEVLERYNFTVDENTSVDIDLSIDPEMLGRIFENLLAEINPETGESARKSTGSYYTPRTIVEYMVEESLYQYLKEKTGISENKLRALSSYDLSDDESHPLNEGEREQVVEALSNITILDPACGSGAFPIGAMQKIVFILQRVDPDANLWFKRQITNTAPEVRRLIEREFKNKNFDYIRKLGVIRRSIFGVDIQPIATEISRLRCFLTLVVEESVKDDKPNRDIEPLPNLDFKFVTANSLIGLPQEGTSAKQQGLFGADEESKIKELKNAMEGYFNSHNSEREEYKKRFYEVRDKLFEQAVHNNSWNKKTQYLSIWDPFSHNPSSWFEPEWMFGVKDGFDIVIANPPYDVYEGYRRGEIEEIRSYAIYDKATGGKLNAYKLFLAKSIELQKPKGILCEIFQNSFLADSSAANIRKYFLQNQKIIQIDSFPERDDVNLRVFEGVKMSVCILLSNNTTEPDHRFLLRIWKDKYMELGQHIMLSNKDIFEFDSDNAKIPSLGQEELIILKNVAKNPKLKKFARCYEGEVNLTFHKKFLSTKKSNNAPMIKGAAVQKWLIKEKMSQGEIEFLDKTAYQKENHGDKSIHFELRRIVMQGITGVDEQDRLKMTIIDPGIFCGNSVNYILINDKKISEKYLLSLLNCTLLNWFFKVFSTNSNVNGYEVDNFPIYEAGFSEQKTFIKIVDKILMITKSEDYLDNQTQQAKVKEHEKQIDQMVYKLYGLTLEEIKIVENCKK